VNACDNPFPRTWDWNSEISVSPLQSACKYLQNSQRQVLPLLCGAFQTHRGIIIIIINNNSNNNNNINTKNDKAAKSSGLTLKMPEVAIIQNLTHPNSHIYFFQQLVSCIRHQNVSLSLDLGPTVSSHHKHTCFLTPYKLSLSYQHSSSPCLSPSTQRYPSSYLYTKEKVTEEQQKTPTNPLNSASV